MKSNSTLKRKTRLRPISKKRQRDMKEYARLRKGFLERNPFCAVWLDEHGIIQQQSFNETQEELGCIFIEKKSGAILSRSIVCAMGAPASTEVHHAAKRGKNYLNTDTWMAVCRANHMRIEEHKSWARERGYLENI